MAIGEKNGTQSDSPKKRTFFTRALYHCASARLWSYGRGISQVKKIATLASHYGNRLLGLTASLHVAAAISL